MKTRFFVAALGAVLIALACVDFSDNTVGTAWCQNHPGECGPAGGGAGGGGGNTDGGLVCIEGATCTNTNEFGSCGGGTQSCTDAGDFGPCVGRIPARDVCDLQDNDCDGKPDQPSASPKLPYTCICPGDRVVREICSNYKDDDCDGVTDCPGEPISFRTFGPATKGDLQIQAVSVTSAGEFIGGYLSSGQFDFVDSGTPAGLADGGESCFVARLDPDGGPALWQTTLLTDSVESTYFDEQSGGLFVSGTYVNALGAAAGCTEPKGSTAAVIYRLDPSDGGIVGQQFICRSDVNGTFRSAQIAGTTADGGILVAGTFDGRLVFEQDKHFLDSDGGLDGYFAVLSPSLDSVSLKQAFGSLGSDTVHAAALYGGKTLWLAGTGATAFDIYGSAVPHSGAAPQGYVAAVNLAQQTASAFNAGSDVNTLLPLSDIEALIGGAFSSTFSLGNCGFPTGTGTASYLLRSNAVGGCNWGHVFDGSNATYVVSQASAPSFIAGGDYSSSLSVDFDAGTLPNATVRSLWLGSFSPDGGVNAFSAFTGGSRFTPSASSGRTIAANYSGSFSFIGRQVDSCTGQCGMLIQVNP